MQFELCIARVADYLQVNALDLLHYAEEDHIGGYEPHAHTYWLPGSIWGAEGQILHAITRVLRPARIAELGALQGCGTSHFASALQANGHGKVLTYDNFRFTHAPFKVDPSYTGWYEFIEADAHTLDYSEYDLVFEDFNDTAQGVYKVWSKFVQQGKPGAVIVSHDAYGREGPEVRAGITQAGITDALMFQVDGTDCGLAIWRKAV